MEKKTSAWGLAGALLLCGIGTLLLAFSLTAQCNRVPKESVPESASAGTER